MELGIWDRCSDASDVVISWSSNFVTDASCEIGDQPTPVECRLTLKNGANANITKISPVRKLTIYSSQLTFVPNSKSRDTKTRLNIKNLARSNLDIVP